jgi:DNA-binding NtrC family response regulator
MEEMIREIKAVARRWFDGDLDELGRRLGYKDRGLSKVLWRGSEDAVRQVYEGALRYDERRKAKEEILQEAKKLDHIRTELGLSPTTTRQLTRRMHEIERATKEMSEKELIEAASREFDVSVKKIAEELGVHHVTLYNKKNGKDVKENPRLKALLRNFYLARKYQKALGG